MILLTLVMEMGSVLAVVHQVLFFLLDTGLLILQILHSVVDEMYRIVRPREEKGLMGEVAV